MARPKKNKKERRGRPPKEEKPEPREPLLSQETKESIVAVIAFLLAILFVVAWFGKAGRIGNLAYTSFDALLGRGYFLMPLSLILVGTALLFSLKQKFVSLPIVGGLIFLLSSLSLADIIFGERTGGLLGFYIAKPFLLMFDAFASGIIFAAFIVIAMLVTFNASLRRSIVQEEENEGEEEEMPIMPEVVKSAEPVAMASDFNEMEEEFIPPQPRVKEDPKKNASYEVLKALKKKASDYKLPSLDLLNHDSGKPSGGDIKANGNMIQRTLHDFGIPVEMGEVNVGPSVTQYTLKPAQGIKLSRISALQNDLALALAAHPLRIEAPIPGKSFVGIEMPNRSISMVGLRSLLEREEYQKAGPLVFALGKDVAGDPVYADLAKMPHLLIAGSTGSGKSVSVHSILMGLLYKNTPLSLRLIMVDPKRVEMSYYQDLPHLLTPVITESKEAISALRWAVREMEERYKILQMARKRDIVSYNASGEEFMPYIVIVIDELADLMASFGREVEASIVRIAQMARAVGIHLVIATQRPSVEVITGLIKANIPTRIAFKVASQIDSRTILDGAGAEKLLGNGDMLYLSSDSGNKPRRIQGAFVSESEVKKVSGFILNQETAPEYNEEILQAKGNAGGGGGEGFDEDEEDELYEPAYAAVMEAGRASTSFLQRRFRLGYARAARIIDLLEKRGVIGPGDGAKPREILIKREESDIHAA